MKIAEEKTKSITISHYRFRCKLVVNDRVIELMQIDNLGTRVTSNNSGGQRRKYNIN